MRGTDNGHKAAWMDQEPSLQNAANLLILCFNCDFVHGYVTMTAAMKKITQAATLGKV